MKEKNNVKAWSGKTKAAASKDLFAEWNITKKSEWREETWVSNEITEKWQ